MTSTITRIAEIVSNNQAIRDLMETTAINYAGFTVELSQCSSLSEIDTINKDNPDAARVNGIVHLILAYFRKGLVQLEISPQVSSHLLDPSVQYAAAESVAASLSNPTAYKSLVEWKDDDVPVLTALYVLGYPTDWISPELIPDATRTALISNLKSTIH